MDLNRQIMETNFFGALRTIQKVIPDMKKRRSGRIINIGSIGSIIGLSFIDGYCASKFALEGLSESLVAVLKAFDVHISNVIFGPVKTSFLVGLGANTNMNEDAVDQETLELLKRNLRLSLENPQVADRIPSVEHAAEVIVRVIEDPSPKLRYTDREESKEFVSIKLKDLSGESVVAHQMKYFET
ncbi:estradiol 17-beta-dehydrogenase 1-like [Ptychodera flava]|uniref:estradiol 17-beta-dehydrogenase 1-like n=1 Tax=Ptychodera flava TaxID=63121 RepID=UPI00396A2643